MAATKPIFNPDAEPGPVKGPSHRDTGKRNVSGVWMVYRVQDGPVVLSPHADELEARRAAMDGDNLKVVQVAWGQTVVEALK